MSGGNLVSLSTRGDDTQLRTTIDKALAVKRDKLAGSWQAFGNVSGHRHTKCESRSDAFGVDDRERD
jgi:hypothetical protein